MKYIFPVVIGAISLLACIEEFRGVHEKHAQVIKEELTIFIDTVKAITLCQAWIPGKEGEPDIYFIIGAETEDSSTEKRDLVIAGEKELKIYCPDGFTPPGTDDTIRIPYLLIDYIDYQSYKYVSYLGQGMTLYLSEALGQNMLH